MSTRFIPSTLSTRGLHFQRFAAFTPGPKLIITGAVHGNETAGTRGIERLLDDLATGRIEIARGTLTVVPVCNPLAFAKGQRFGERNLNRRLLPSTAPREYEDHIANVLCPLLAEHEVLLDLHSFRGPGEPFVLRGPANNTGSLEPFKHEVAEAHLAAHVDVRRVVDGWLDAYARGVAARQARGLTPGAVNEHSDYGVGTTEYMRRAGGYSLTLECGQHEDPLGPEVAYTAITQTLALLKMADPARLPLQPAPAAGAFECLTLADVIDRFDANDRFAKPWASFDAVAAGELIATRADGTPVHAPSAGRIVFPDVGAKPGSEWFYMATQSPRSLHL